MEKILLVINAHRPDMVSIDFACRMASFAQTKLTGLFIENLSPKPDTTYTGIAYFKNVRQKLHGSVHTDTDHAIRLFKDECNRRRVLAQVYVDKGNPTEEVLFESRFADLLILDPYTGFYDRDEELPSPFVKEILARSECPVLLAPENFEEVEEIVFCYDGSASSVFAVKLFTYLIPEFSVKKVMLLEVNKTGKEEFDEGHRRMMDWLKAHYHSVYYHALAGEVKDELFAYFFRKRKRMIVMGAYGRNILSNFFKTSNADLLIQSLDLPLFIAHH